MKPSKPSLQLRKTPRLTPHAHRAPFQHLLALQSVCSLTFPLSSPRVASSGQYGGLSGQGCTSLTPGDAALTHQSRGTPHQPMPSSHRSGSSISLCKSWQLTGAPTQLQSRSTPGSGRADPPRNHPSFMGCNLSSEWVTGGQRDSQARSTMGLHLSFSFPSECVCVQMVLEILSILLLLNFSC